MIGTLVCAIIPTYASIGLAAPIGLMIARILISFSTGGEFGSGTAALMIEQKSRRKAFLGSWQFSSQGMSTRARFVCRTGPEHPALAQPDRSMGLARAVYFRAAGGPGRAVSAQAYRRHLALCAIA